MPMLQTNGPAPRRLRRDGVADREQGQAGHHQQQAMIHSGPVSPSTTLNTSSRVLGDLGLSRSRLMCLSSLPL